MASLRDYFEIDFPTTAVVRYELEARTEDNAAVGFTLFAQAHIDFVAHVKFCSFYIPQTDQPLVEVAKSVLARAPDVLALRRGKQITLPKTHSAWTGAGIEIRATEYLDVALVPLEGGTFDVRDFLVAPPIYIYSDQELDGNDADEIIDLGRRHNAVVRLRGPKYAMERTTKEKPAAFISHDSRNKEDIARPLAVGLSRLGYTVWFDEFTLKPGDRLRESIEQGVKYCRECVLVLTPDFLSNKGWGATEFNAVFSREIIEEKALVVPVWAGVTKNQVFEYSPTLVNVLGAHWDADNSEKCIREIARALDE